jgi:hypothetical protein
MTSLICENEYRREAVRSDRKLCGLDYLEVRAPQATLTSNRPLTTECTLIVHLLGKAPRGARKLDQKNVVIEGGSRISDIQVVKATSSFSNDPEFDDTLEVVVDRVGDFSTYTLRVVEPDSQGRPHPHPSFDPRYDSLDFNFKVDCPSDLDCFTAPQCPPPERKEPEISYLAKDYASFRQLILDRLALVMPDWKERHVPDVGIALVELLAYAGDYLSYYQDAVATEAYLDTARLRISVRRHARLVDYQLNEGCNSRAWVRLETNLGADPLELTPRDGNFAPPNFYFVTGPDGAPDGPILTQQDLSKLKAGSYEVFEPMTDQTIRVYQAHNAISFYTWGNESCCLDRGATSASLVGELVRDTEDANPATNKQGDPAGNDKSSPDKGPAKVPKLHLGPGDVLIFEEMVGPKTGNASDADHGHRHAVRLTRVEAAVDPLNGQSVVEITWAASDALPFPLCISALGPAPECKILHDVSVARGNVVLVDHGITIQRDLDPVPVKTTVQRCECEEMPADIEVTAGLFRPVLKEAPLTFSQPLVSNWTAGAALTQDSRKALAQVRLISDPAPEGDPHWSVRSDLLASSATNQHFVAEIDNDGRAHLRFGDGELGRKPDAGMKFQALYRTGNGVAGNVGAEAIKYIVFSHVKRSDGITRITNPLAASAGVEPEPLVEAKLLAPHAFRQEIERAIIGDDYAALAMRDFSTQVQHAAATLRWNGSWYEALVAVDELGKEHADFALLSAIYRRLHRYRRIGHDVTVRSARLIPLIVELRVCVHPHYLRGHVEAALLDVFSNRLLPDGRKGFFHPDNLSFGEGIYLSRLVASAQAVEGVDSVEVTKLERAGEGPHGEIDDGLLRLGPFEVAQVDNDPSLPENGTFTLKIGGGR